MIGSGGGYSDAVGDALGGDVDGGASTAGQGHPGNRGRGRGGPRGGPRGYSAPGYNNDPFGEFGFRGQPNSVGPNVDNFAGMGLGTRGRDSAYGRNAESERGLAQAMANINPSRGLARGNPGMPQVQRDAGWVPGQTLTDKHGNPVTLDNLSFQRDDLLDDENYERWAQQNPDKVRNTPGMLGGLLNSLGLHDLTGAMTPKENAFADSRWGGSIGEGPSGDIFPQGGRPNAVNVGGPGGWQGIPPQLIRQLMHQRALSQEGGDNYDGRYERRNPRTYESGFEGGDQPD
jgi:hypothetical protein